MWSPSAPALLPPAPSQPGPPGRKYRINRGRCPRFVRRPSRGSIQRPRGFEDNGPRGEIRLKRRRGNPASGRSGAGRGPRVPPRGSNSTCTPSAVSRPPGRRWPRPGSAMRRTEPVSACATPRMSASAARPRKTLRPGGAIPRGRAGVRGGAKVCPPAIRAAKTSSATVAPITPTQGWPRSCRCEIRPTCACASPLRFPAMRT